MKGVCDTDTILRLAAFVMLAGGGKGNAWPRKPTRGPAKIGIFLRLSQLTLSAGLFTVTVAWKSLVRVGVDDS